MVISGDVWAVIVYLFNSLFNLVITSWGAFREAISCFNFSISLSLISVSPSSFFIIFSLSLRTNSFWLSSRFFLSVDSIESSSLIVSISLFISSITILVRTIGLIISIYFIFSLYGICSS